MKLLKIIAIILFITAGFFAYGWTKGHVSYYTGDKARYVNCLLCHFYAKGGYIADRILKPEYHTPVDISLCGNGKYLYVIARDSNALLVVDTLTKQVVKELDAGGSPYRILLNSDCNYAYVSNRGLNTVSVINLKTGNIDSIIPTGLSPSGIAFSANENKLFTANWLSNDISIIDNKSQKEITRLAAGNNPKEMALSLDKSMLLVTNQMSYIVKRPEPPLSEATLIDTLNNRVINRYQLENAHLSGGVAISSENDIALIPLIRPKNLIPALQVERGWVMAGGVALISLKENRVVQFPLDDVDLFYADPSDVVITPDNKYCIISHGGADVVTILDMSVLLRLFNDGIGAGQSYYANRLALSRQYVVKRIATKANPGRLVVSSDGRFVYVLERLNDSIGVIDLKQLKRTGEIDLGGSRHISIVRRGEILFHNASSSLQGQFSCRSCHPDGHMDRLQYDLEPNGLGRNILDNRSLLGIKETGPFKWNGKNTSLYMQCGIRFAKFLTRSAPFGMEDLNALAAYIESLEPLSNTYKNSDHLTSAQMRGKIIFEQKKTASGKLIPEEKRCVVCHPSPFFTNREKANVGSISLGDSSGLFDTPHLRNIAFSAPYLHDGKALTLEEIWTIYNPDDRHGVTSDMGKQALNDLVEYLKIL